MVVAVMTKVVKMTKMIMTMMMMKTMAMVAMTMMKMVVTKKEVAHSIRRESGVLVLTVAGRVPLGVSFCSCSSC
jgi:hypothetical protein